MSTRVEVTVKFEFGTDDPVAALAAATDRLAKVPGARISHTHTFHPSMPDPYSDLPEGTD